MWVLLVKIIELRVNEMSELTYKIERLGNDVFYYIYRGDELVIKKEALPLELGILKLIYYAFLRSDENMICALLKKANKLARCAIKSMEKYEK